MFLDETGITTNLLRRYGRAPRGARVHDHAPCGRWQTSTFLAALRVTGLTAPGVFDGAIDGESFRAYIEQILVPTLQPGDIVIADNLGAHKVAGIQRAIQAAGATLWYLPPYSPDLTPIELCFAKLKALVRTARCRSTETLWPFLGECLAHFSPDECRNYFCTAGTRPPHGHEKRFRLRPYWRVATPMRICSTTRRVSGSVFVQAWTDGSATSWPSRRTRGRRRATFRPPSTTSLGAWPARDARRAG